MVMVDVRYAILGYKGVSSIKIGSNKDVAELKNKLKTSDDALARVNVRDITLFKVNIAVPDKPTYGSVVDSISQHTIEFNRGDELDDTFCELSTTPGGFPTRHIHILVELPAGESFCSRPGRDVAEIGLSLTTPTLQRLADHPLPPHLSLADRLSLPNHSLIVQHRPLRRPYASWADLLSLTQPIRTHPSRPSYPHRASRR